MIDLLPWLIILLVLGLAVGYAFGRRSVTTPPAEGSQASRPPAPQSQSHSQSAPAPRADAPVKPSQVPAPQGRPQARGLMSLSQAQSWGYQLQHIDLKRAEASPFDMLVIDYTKDGSDESALKPAELERLKRKPDGSRRLVICYVSIGEAESYRSYWQKDWKRNKPKWLLGENPEWKENYSVCFWEPEWQQLFCGAPDAYIDRIMAQGFDGIYLDKCDVTEDLREHFKQVARSRPGMDKDMISFVQRISSYTKSKNPNFAIIMQNAEPLLEHADLRRAIDAVAKEELLFGLDRPEKPNTRDEISWSRERLDLMKRDGKPVFVVEYLDNRARIAEAAAEIKKLGYVLFISPKDRELAKLNYVTLEA